MDIQNDRMFRAQDGSWISLTYHIFNSRVVMISFFTHHSPEPPVTWFDRTAGA